MLAEDEDIGETPTTIVVVCSNGCFLQPVFARQLCRAAEQRARVVPIVAEGGFRFPTREFLEELVSLSAHLLGGTRYEAEDLVSLVQRVFQEIALAVNTHESDHVLQVRVRLIGQRLTDTGLRQLEPGPRREVDPRGHARTNAGPCACEEVERTGIGCADVEDIDDVEGVGCEYMDELDLVEGVGCEDMQQIDLLAGMPELGANDEVVDEATGVGAVFLDL